MHDLQVQEFARAVERKVPIIVVDPRYSVAASKARYWLPIELGTDLALILAWMNVLVMEGWYDRTIVAQYAHGFDKFVDEIKSATPEWATTGLRSRLHLQARAITARAFFSSIARPCAPAASQAATSPRTPLMN